MKVVKRIIVSAVIISRDNKILMGKKDPNGDGVFPNCWHIPGGGIEKDEDLMTALQREVLEEVRINISNYQKELVNNKARATAEKTVDGEKILADMKFNTYRIILKDKNSNEIRVRLGEEFIEYNWFTFPELSKIKNTPMSEKLFKKLGYT